MEKLQNIGAKVVACSDSSGFLFDDNGIDLLTIKEIKEENRARLSEYLSIYPNASYQRGGNIWDVPCELAFPCATQNELDVESAKTLLKNGCISVVEGANMPCTPSAVDVFRVAKIAYGPGKAANAGGVATSALEMQQNASRDSWTFEATERRLHDIMVSIHDDCFDTAEDYGCRGDYLAGANISAFKRVAEAMLAFGVV